MFFSLNWFICLFCDKLDSKISLPILDQIMIRGSEVLHNLGLSILYLMQEHILHMKDFRKSLSKN
jgi:hypothetical protein